MTGPWTEDPRLVEVYDVECAGRWDHDLYLALADELGVGSVVDIGCGTGVFAVDASARGLRAVGVDPAGAMLDVARNRPGGSAVVWLEGGADRVPDGSAELAIMMGHVAQYFLSDRDWHRVLAQVHRLLVPGGWLAFETRNPAVDWAGRWTRERTEVTHPHPAGGRFTSWVEVVEVVGAPASYTQTHEANTILPDGTHLRAVETLRFRSPAEVEASLADAGFEIGSRWGDWDRSPFSPDSAELIVVARLRPEPDGATMER